MFKENQEQNTARIQQEIEQKNEENETQMNALKGQNDVRNSSFASCLFVEKLISIVFCE